MVILELINCVFFGKCIEYTTFKFLMKVRSSATSLGVPLTFLLLHTFNHLLDCKYFKIIFHGVIICSLQFLVRKNGTHHRLDVMIYTRIFK